MKINRKMISLSCAFVGVALISSTSSSYAAAKKPQLLNPNYVQSRLLGRWYTCNVRSRYFKSPTRPGLSVYFYSNGKYEIAEASYTNGEEFPPFSKERGQFHVTQAIDDPYDDEAAFDAVLKMTPESGKAYSLNVNTLGVVSGAEVIEIPGLYRASDRYCRDFR